MPDLEWLGFPTLDKNNIAEKATCRLIMWTNQPRKTPWYFIIKEETV